MAAGGVLPQPGMWWWATYYARPATEEEATAQARQRLSLMLTRPGRDGHLGRGRSGEPSPLEAMDKVCAERQFDEIIVATLPRRVSRWLGADLPRQAQRRFRLPVTAIITSYYARRASQRWPRAGAAAARDPARVQPLPFLEAA